MSLEEENDFIEILLKAHKKSQEKAIDDSIRTGVPLAISVNGKIIDIHPQFKYIKVPIDFELNN